MPKLHLKASNQKRPKKNKAGKETNLFLQRLQKEVYNKQKYKAQNISSKYDPKSNLVIQSRLSIKEYIKNLLLSCI